MMYGGIKIGKLILRWWSFSQWSFYRQKLYINLNLYKLQIMFGVYERKKS